MAAERWYRAFVSLDIFRQLNRTSQLQCFCILFRYQEAGVQIADRRSDILRGNVDSFSPR